jgi:hypothetical protein
VKGWLRLAFLPLAGVTIELLLEARLAKPPAVHAVAFVFMVAGMMMAVVLSMFIVEFPLPWDHRASGRSAIPASEDALHPKRNGHIEIVFFGTPVPYELMHKTRRHY